MHHCLRGGAARGSGVGMDGKLIAQISSGPEMKSNPQMGVQKLLRFVAGVAIATSGTLLALSIATLTI